MLITLGPMVENMMESGRTESSTESVFTLQQVENPKRENGVKEKELTGSIENIIQSHII